MVCTPVIEVNLNAVARAPALSWARRWAKYVEAEAGQLLALAHNVLLAP